MEDANDEDQAEGYRAEDYEGWVPTEFLEWLLLEASCQKEKKECVIC
jgi:hypothetical protein